MPWLNSLDDLPSLDTEIEKVIVHDFHWSRDPQNWYRLRWWCKCGAHGHWHDESTYPVGRLKVRWAEHCKNQWKRKKKV